MSMLQTLHRYIIPAAWSVLPPTMGTPPATALLLAIAQQESDGVTARRQYGRGPARGFWQFEPIGVRGVYAHPAVQPALYQALTQLRYKWDGFGPKQAYQVVEHNDVLAAVLARLLLWTLPDRLPGPSESAQAWHQYLAAWRPGKPHLDTWHGYYTHAWKLVDGAQEATHG